MNNTDDNNSKQVIHDPVAPKHPELVTPDRSATANQQIPELLIDKGDLRRLAIKREEESRIVAETLGLNTVELDTQKESLALDAEADAKREAWVQKVAPTQAAVDVQVNGNAVESDEVFTADQREGRPIIPPEVEQAFVQVGSKFYHHKSPDSVAFEDKGNKLETRSNSEAVVENMVRIAEARGWDEIKVSGSETVDADRKLSHF